MDLRRWKSCARSRASEPQIGYEIHHIVEKTAAQQDGFPDDMIEGYDHLARVPTYRHHEITASFQRRNEEFDGLSPREYLRGKDWSERVRVGLLALEEFEVIAK